RDSSAPSSCSTRASSTASFTAGTCATRSVGCSSSSGARRMGSRRTASRRPMATGSSAPPRTAPLGRRHDAVSQELQQALETLYGLERQRVKLGLDGTRRLLEALENPQTLFRAVHVAGTNGKGSVCALIERVLRASGKRTGLFTSPHLVDFRERI